VIQHEPNTFNQQVEASLKLKGHQLKSVGRRYGNMHAILWDKRANKVTSASDPRGSGSAIVEKTH